MARFRPGLLIFFLTVAIRCIPLLHVPPEDFLYGEMTPQGFKSPDEGINVAYALSHVGEFANPFCEPTGPTAHLPPSFPFVTAGIYRLFGYGRAAAAVRNGINIAGLGLLYGSFPTAAVALDLGAQAGIFAGVGAALFPSFRAAEIQKGRDEWAAAVLLLWLTVLTYRTFRRGAIEKTDIALFVGGWAVLLHMQPSMLTLLPFQALFCAVGKDRWDREARVKSMALAVSMIMLLLVPWTIRNRSELGGWFFMRDNLGLELRAAYGDGAAASEQLNLINGWLDQVHPQHSAAAAREVARVGELRFNHRLFREALSWMSSHPQRSATLVLTRFVEFWADLPAIRIRAVRLLWSCLAATGLILMWRSGLRLQILMLAPILVVYPLIYYLIQYSNRYVVPICFAIFLPAGFALARIYASLLNRQRG